MAAHPPQQAQPAPAELHTPSAHSPEAVAALGEALNALVADAYALFVKTKNFHWHVSGPHFRDYHLLFEEQAEQVFAMTDVLAERVRMLGGATIRSIGQIAKLKRLPDSDESFVPAGDMMRRLIDDNRALVASMREAHRLCERHGDVATLGRLEQWIEEAEKRVWFLFEASRGAAH